MTICVIPNYPILDWNDAKTEKICVPKHHSSLSEVALEPYNVASKFNMRANHPNK